MEFNKKKKDFFFVYDIVHESVLTDYADGSALKNVVCCILCALLPGYSLAARNCSLLSTLNELNCMHSPHDTTRCPFTAFIKLGTQLFRASRSSSVD